MINRSKISKIVAFSLAVTTVFGISIPKNVSAVETAETLNSTDVSTGSAVDESPNPDTLSEILSDIKADNEFENYSVFLKDSSLMQLGNDIKTSYALEYVNITDPTLANVPVVSLGRVSEKYGLSAGIEDEVYVSDLNKIINPKRGLHLYKVTGEDLINILEWTASLYDTEEVYDKVVLDEEVKETDKPDDSAEKAEDARKAEDAQESKAPDSTDVNSDNEVLKDSIEDAGGNITVLSVPAEVSELVSSTVLNAPAVVENILKAENEDSEVLEETDTSAGTKSSVEDATTGEAEDPDKESEDATSGAVKDPDKESEDATSGAVENPDKESEDATSGAVNVPEDTASGAAVATESAVPSTKEAVETASPSATEEAEPEETDATETEVPSETTVPASPQAVKVYNLFEYDLQTVLDNYYVIDGINYTVDLKGSALFDDEGN
nr:hypothetical protein [Lachnospiraceae bacterium]